VKKLSAILLLVSYLSYAPACFLGMLGMQHAAISPSIQHMNHTCNSTHTACRTMPYTDINSHVQMYSNMTSADPFVSTPQILLQIFVTFLAVSLLIFRKSHCSSYSWRFHIKREQESILALHSTFQKWISLLIQSPSFAYAKA
jgi:hypothetical protein